jgi:predicted small metal-binding protein
MSKTIACNDLFPGCDFKAEAESEAELLQKVAAHATSAHGVTEITDDMVGKVKSCIRDA